MIPSDLETLRAILQDNKTWISQGVILALETASDKSVLRAKVRLLPTDHVIIARVTHSATGPDSGDFSFPVVNDMVIVAMSEGSEDYPWIISRCSSKEDFIPEKAIQGHMVRKALAGKKNYIQSDTAIHLTKTADGTEPLVLGLVMQQAYLAALLRLTTLLDKLLTVPIVTTTLPGFPASIDPTLATEIQQIKQDIEDDIELYSTDDTTNFLSQLTFTERGAP